MQSKLTLQMGEETCASEPGNFCRMVRTKSYGQKFFCALYETKLFDSEGWLQRCPQCREEFPSHEEDPEGHSRDLR